MLMPLFWILAVIIIAGVVLWFLNQVPAIDPTMKTLARAVIILIVVIVVLYALFGLFSGLAPGGHPLLR